MRGVALACICADAAALGLQLIWLATGHRHAPLIVAVLMIGSIASGTWYLRMRRDT